MKSLKKKPCWEVSCFNNYDIGLWYYSCSYKEVEYTLGGARLENSSIANLDVYPNPSRDVFNVAFSSEETQDIIITVVNMLSEVVFVEEFKSVKGHFSQQIDLASQAKGIYSLKISNPSLNIYKRIALQ